MKPRRLRRLLIALSLLALLGGGVAEALSTIIRVTVRTELLPSGEARLRGRRVRITNVVTGETREGVTDAAGEVAIDTGNAAETASPVYRVDVEGLAPRYTTLGSGTETKLDLIQRIREDDPRGLKSFQQALDDYAKARGLTGPPNWWIEEIEKRTDPGYLDPLEEYSRRLRQAASGEKPAGPVEPLDPQYRDPLPPLGPPPPPRTVDTLDDRDRRILRDELRRIDELRDLTPKERQDLIDRAHRSFGVDAPPRPPEGPVQGPLPPDDPTRDVRAIQSIQRARSEAENRELEAIEKSDLRPDEKARLREQALDRHQRNEPPSPPPDNPFPPAPYDEFGLPRGRDQHGQPIPAPPGPTTLSSRGPAPGRRGAFGDPSGPPANVSSLNNTRIQQGWQQGGMNTQTMKVGELRAVSPGAAAIDPRATVESAGPLPMIAAATNLPTADSAKLDPKGQDMGATMLSYADHQLVLSQNVQRMGDVAAIGETAFRALATGPPRQPSHAQNPVVLQVLFTSLGKSSGPAFTMTVVHDSPIPLQLVGSGFVLQALANLTATQAQQALARTPGRRATATISAYCLNMLKAPPTPGTMFRLAPSGVQDRYPTLARVMEVSRQLKDAGALNPDGDPVEYFHSTRQWAIWALERRFDEEAFTRALLDHARKNLTAAGRRWSRDVETAIRELVPNRWRDIAQVLALAKTP